MSNNDIFSVKLFNDTIAAIVLSHATRLGILDELDQHGRIELESFCEEKEFNSRILFRFLKVLSFLKVVESGQDGVWQVGPKFPEFHRNGGYFEWLLLGYGGLLVSDTIGGRNCILQSTVGRNGAEVAAGSARIGAHYVDPILERVIMDEPFQSVIDLGCGGANRILSLASRYPTITAAGIEIDQKAISIARVNVEANGLQDRVSIIEADVESLDPDFFRDLSQDLVMMNFMGHDMWPIDKALSVFRRLRSCFPRCKRFLLADTLRSELDDTVAAGIFTIGFELIHEISDRYIPSEAEWMALLPRSGWEIRRIIPLEVPYTKVFELGPSKRD